MVALAWSLPHAYNPNHTSKDSWICSSLQSEKGFDTSQEVLLHLNSTVSEARLRRTFDQAVSFPRYARYPA